MKITQQAASLIRKLHAEGRSVRSLADEFNIGPEHVRRILRWEVWRSAPELAPSRPVPSGEEIAASEERLAKLLSGEATGEGLARLHKEAAGNAKGNQLLDELEEPKKPTDA